MFNFFISNNLISPKQSGFKPGDSCINQLLSITHEIYKSFDEGLEVRGVFLDISKAFDKVWHEGLIFKLKQNGISGDLLQILSDFLGGAPTSICHFFHPSIHLFIRLFVCRAAYLGNHTSSDHNFRYTYVKWWYLQMFLSFFQNFDFLGC